MEFIIIRKSLVRVSDIECIEMANTQNMLERYQIKPFNQLITKFCDKEQQQIVEEFRSEEECKKQLEAYLYNLNTH
jgi:hypothetical protein